MNDCKKMSDSFCESLTKGPWPCSVPQIAIPESTQVTVTVSRSPSRNAAQISGGMHRNESG